MENFLLDRSFLLKVNQHKIRRYKAAILCLDFETENPLARLEGKVVSGNINIAANSPTRRTGSLTVIFDDQTKNIADINNLIAVNKKISLSIGIENPFYHTGEYRKYGDVLWFKQGVFFITSASSSISNNSRQVSINLIDKMGMLNGTVGGILPASVSFHEAIVYDADGNYSTQYPLIIDIIKECVHHYGGEHYSRISVEGVPEVGRQVVRYDGTTPINFATGDNKLNSGTSFVIGSPPITGFDDVYYKGDNVGYMETPLTYPGELIQNSGSTVTAVLDEIVNTLGNYEYYYDVDGIFHFGQIKNYLQTGNTPLNFDSIDDSALQSLYFPRYSDDMYINEFADKNLVTQVSFSPNYSNIKNDFIVWGTKNSTDGDQSMVRYHLAIDTRPKDIPKPEPGSPEELTIGSGYSLCHKSIWSVKDKNTRMILRYQIYPSSIDNLDEEWGEEVAPVLEDTFPDLPDAWFNWREELYRQALMAYGSSTDGSYYDEELLAEWRNVYDPTSSVALKGADSFQGDWEAHYGEGSMTNPWTGYIVDVKIAPEKLRYWLDLIDTSSELGAYSVSRIGRRSVVKENSKINMVFEAAIKDIVFIENTGDVEDMMQKAQYYANMGQSYAFLTSEQMPYFQQKNSFGTCMEAVRELMYNNLIYNISVNLTSIPIFYLDVNQNVHLNFEELGIIGDFTIKSISCSFGNNPSMTLQLNEAIVIN